MSDATTEDISISVWVFYPDLEKTLKNVKIPLDCTLDMLEDIYGEPCPGEQVYNIKLVSSHSNIYNNIFLTSSSSTHLFRDQCN